MPTIFWNWCFTGDTIFNDIFCCLAELNFYKCTFSFHYTNKSRRTTLLFCFFLLCTIRYQFRQKSAIGYLKIIKKKLKKTFTLVSHVKSITCMRSSFFKTYCFYQQDAPSRTKGPSGRHYSISRIHFRLQI